MTSTNPDKYTENFWLSFAEITTAGITKSREWCATVSFFEEFKQRIYDIKNASSSLPSDSNSHRKHPYAGQGGVAERDEQLSYISGESTTPTAGNRNGVDFFETDSYYDGIEYGVSPNYKTKPSQTTPGHANRAMRRRESEAEASVIERTLGRSKRSSSYCTGVPDTERVSIDYSIGMNGMNGVNGGYKHDVPVPSSLKTGHVIMAPISNFSNTKEPSNFIVYTIQPPISTVDAKYILSPPQQVQSQTSLSQTQAEDVNSDPLYCFIKREFPDAHNEFINKQLQILLSEGVFGLSSLCVTVKNQSQWEELERKLDPKLCDAIDRNFRDSQQQMSVASGTSPQTMPATPSAFELVDGSAISSPGVDFSPASRTFSKYGESLGNEDGASSPPPSLEQQQQQQQQQQEEVRTIDGRREYLNEEYNQKLTRSTRNKSSTSITTDLSAVVSRKGGINKSHSINNFGRFNVVVKGNIKNNDNGSDGYDDDDDESSSKKSYDDDDTKSICLDETFL